MGRIEMPKDWERMNYGEKLIWLFEKQQELERSNAVESPPDPADKLRDYLKQRARLVNDGS